MKNAKYAVGDKVTVKTRRGLVSGSIVEMHRLYKAVDATGKFKRTGLVTREDTINSIVLPYTFDGETLAIRYSPSRTEVSKLWSWGYTIAGALPYRIGVDEKDILSKA